MGTNEQQVKEMLGTEAAGRVLSTGASVPGEPGCTTGTSVNSQAGKLTPFKTESLQGHY